MDLTTMQRACASTERILEHVAPEHHDLPTPCAEWDTRALLNHVFGTLALGAALLGDVAPTVSMEPGGLPDVDMVGDDPVKAYRVCVDGLLAAAGGDALGRTHTTPLGEMPGSVLGGFTTLDVAVHGWDLARATGQRANLDDDLANEVLAFARQTITDTTRAPRIGPAIAPGPGASATDRLVAFLGRRP
ncbi:MAG: TIGR03086 family metal-binding protein [Acidimicrobiales bacterium]